MIRVAVLDSDRCKPKDCGTTCIKYCPMVRSSIDAIKIEEDADKPTIFETLCSGCGICESICNYDAITLVETDKGKIAVINDLKCKRCGVCSAACPAEAISISNFTTEQIIAEIEGVLV